MAHRNQIRNIINIYLVLRILGLAISSIECQIDYRFTIKNIKNQFDLITKETNLNLINNNNFQVKINEAKANSHILRENFKFESNEFSLDNQYDNFTVIYGYHATVWLLAKPSEQNSLNDLYYSNDDGLTFVKYQKILNGKDSVQIDNIYVKGQSVILLPIF